MGRVMQQTLQIQGSATPLGNSSARYVPMLHYIIIPFSVGDIGLGLRDGVW